MEYYFYPILRIRWDRNTDMKRTYTQQKLEFISGYENDIYLLF